MDAPQGGGAPPPGAGAAPTTPPSGLKAWAQNEFEPPEHRLKYLPTGADDGRAQVQWPNVDNSVYKAMLAPYGSIAARTHRAPIALVRLDQLTAIQGHVNKERLAQHLADPHIYPEGTKASGHGGLIDRPVVVKLNNELYIHDGHHRLMAQHLRGLSTAKVRLVDLDAEIAAKNPPAPLL